MQRVTAITILFLLSASMLTAQVDRPRNLPAFDYKKLHWGFTVGVNSMDYSIRRSDPEVPGYSYADVIGFQPAGFQVNIVSDLRLSDNWNLRFLPGINLGSRQIVFFDENWKPKRDSIMIIGSSFLDFPLLLKYRSERVNNYRPYVIGGLSYRIDMMASGKYKDDDVRYFNNSIKGLVKTSDVYLEVGFGIDHYLQYFKYSTELKLAMGLRNIKETGSDEAIFDNSILGLRSFLVMLNFHFE